MKSSGNAVGGTRGLAGPQGDLRLAGASGPPGSRSQRAAGSFRCSATASSRLAASGVDLRARHGRARIHTGTHIALGVATLILAG